MKHWINKTGKKVICFSGGLAMNIKTNGEILKLKEVKYLSVPASGGDESLSAGACFAASKDSKKNVKHLVSPYLGSEAKFDKKLFSDYLKKKIKIKEILL